jgi:hypothetical protein
MDQALALYITTYYSELMTAEEHVANRHLATAFKATSGRSDRVAQDEVRSEGGLRARWLSDDPRILELTADGIDAFRRRVATRILAEHPHEIFLNYCPQCGGLTRTPKAKLCLHCGHSWHHETAG